MGQKASRFGIWTMVVVAIFATACAVLSPYAALYGQWDLQQNSGGNGYRFVFNTDDTWSLTQTSSGNTVAVSGTYTGTANTVALTGTKVLNNGADVTSSAPSYKAMYDGTWGWSVSGTVLTMTSPGGGAASLFNKVQ